MNHYQMEALERLRSDLAKYMPEIKYEDVEPHFLDMAKADQTGPWHREGDVLTHTYMVVEGVDYVLDTRCGGPDYENNPIHRALLFTGWFHDIGKYASMEFSDKHQRNTFNGHEKKSATIWRQLYTGSELDHVTGERLYELIAHHGDPTHYVKGRASNRTYLKLAKQVCPYHIYLFELADFQGRIADEIESAYEMLEKFKQKYLENHPAMWEYDRFANMQSHSIAELEQLFVDRCLILPVAVPGTGKTYLRQELLEKFGDIMTVISPDDIRTELFKDKPYDPKDNNTIFGIVHRRMKEAMEQSSKSKHQLIYLDAQNATVKDRSKPVEMAGKYGLKTVCFWSQTKLDTILKQNADRDRAVDEEYIKMRIGHLQYPNEDESLNVVVMPRR